MTSAIRQRADSWPRDGSLGAVQSNPLAVNLVQAPARGPARCRLAGPGQSQWETHWSVMRAVLISVSATAVSRPAQSRSNEPSRRLSGCGLVRWSAPASPPQPPDRSRSNFKAVRGAHFNYQPESGLVAASGAKSETVAAEMMSPPPLTAATTTTTTRRQNRNCQLLLLRFRRRSHPSSAANLGRPEAAPEAASTFSRPLQ